MSKKVNAINLWYIPCFIHSFTHSLPCRLSWNIHFHHQLISLFRCVAPLCALWCFHLLFLFSLRLLAHPVLFVVSYESTARAAVLLYPLDEVPSLLTPKLSSRTQSSSRIIIISMRRCPTALTIHFNFTDILTSYALFLSLRLSLRN